MRKPPELLVMLAPAALVTAIVVTLGFVVGDADDNPQKAAVQTIVTSPSATTSAAPDLAQPEALGYPGKLVGPQVTLKPKPRPKFKVYDAYEFQIASFNVLGHSHTIAGGTKARYAASSVRTGWALSALSGASIDIVGLQEFQAPQYHNFMGRAGGTWDVYPGMAAGHLGVENSIAWRQDQFDLVEAHTVGITYFHGQIRQMPYVLLKHRSTGQKLWVANFHNPATTSGQGNNYHWRRVATSREIALANDLGSGDTGDYPVFFTGDMNERMEYCAPLTSNTALKSAHGDVRYGSDCGSSRGMQVDWIFGSETIDFTRYDVLDYSLIDRTTDHPLVTATASVPEYKERIVYKKP